MACCMIRLYSFAIIAGLRDPVPDSIPKTAVGGGLAEKIDDLVFHYPVKPGFDVLNFVQAMPVFPQFQEYLLNDVFDMLLGLDQALRQRVQPVLMVLKNLHEEGFQSMFVAATVEGV